MTTPSVRSSNSSTENVATTSHGVDYPATISSGDLLIALMAVDVSTTKAAWPSGWMPVAFVGSGVSMHAAFKIATGSESGSITVTTTASVTSQHIMYSVYDWSGDIGDISWNGLRVPASTTKDPQEIFTGLAAHDCLFIAATAVDSSRTVTAWPTNYTDNQVQINGALMCAAATRAVSSATSDDPDAFTLNSSDDGAVMSIAIPGPSPTNPYPKIAAIRFDSEQADTTAPVVYMPADIDSGDLILWALASDGVPSVTVPTTLGTFTAIGSANRTTACKIFVYGKVADGTEASGSMTLTTDSEEFQIGVWIIKNWSGTLADIEVATSDGASTAPDPASLTPSWGAGNTLWAYFGVVDATSGAVTGWPTTYYSSTSLQGLNTTSCSMFAAFRRENTTVVDPAALTITPTDDWAIVHLAIREYSSSVSYPQLTQWATRIYRKSGRFM